MEILRSRAKELPDWQDVFVSAAEGFTITTEVDSQSQVRGQISLQSLHHLDHHHDDQMTLVRVLGSASPREVRMTTWYGEQSGMESLLHNHPKNPNKIFGLV